MCIACASAVVRSGWAVWTTICATRRVVEEAAASSARRVARTSTLTPGRLGITRTPSE